jgi:hypothetical protein
LEQENYLTNCQYNKPTTHTTTKKMSAKMTNKINKMAYKKGND